MPCIFILVDTEEISFASDVTMKHIKFFFDNLIEIFYMIELSIVLNIKNIILFI